MPNNSNSEKLKANTCEPSKQKMANNEEEYVCDPEEYICDCSVCGERIYVHGNIECGEDGEGGGCCKECEPQPENIDIDKLQATFGNVRSVCFLGGEKLKGNASEPSKQKMANNATPRFTDETLFGMCYMFDEHVNHTYVEIRAYLNRLTQAIEEQDEWEEKQAAKEISLKLRSLQYSRSTRTSNEVVACLGLEKYGWKLAEV